MHDVRLAYIQFALSFLIAGDDNTIGQVLELKGGRSALSRRVWSENNLPQWFLPEESAASLQCAEDVGRP